MRLADTVVQSSPMRECLENGRTLLLPGAGSLGPALAGCGLRYILDRAASSQCSAVMFAKGGVLSEPAELPRLPLRPFWLECFPDDDPAGNPTGPGLGRRGFYVQPNAEGSGGTIECVVETNSGEACLLAASVVFDLGEPLSESMGGHRMRHDESTEIDRLLEHARLLVHEGWGAHARTLPGGYGHFVAFQAQRAWLALPLIFSFIALLNARTAFTQRASSLARVNTARNRNGKRSLLEHVEIRLNLTPSERRFAHGSFRVADRHAPRLHFVRGHQVSRGGSTFWRSPHFRGSGTDEAIRTVVVTAHR